MTVFAAASLTEAFRALGTEFEGNHPGVEVAFNFAAAPTLVTQIQQGAPADVFASADEPNMKKAVDTGEVEGAPRTFARNHLQIAVAAGNPKRITGLADLTKPGLTIAGVAPDVPVGRYGAEAFAKAGLQPPEASREESVKAVVNRIALGEADAGIVYVTDVKAAAGKVGGVEIPEEQNVVARYPIAALREAPHGDAARAFVEFVLSRPGQEVMSRFGFLEP
ncbi:MAG: molybdate ABC transporter substrate-binding protein [Actinomycetota bacterium]|nr:molybdate ABC transporter substrate-binding protein [Actinomycetota bacterium]